MMGPWTDGMGWGSGWGMGGLGSLIFLVFLIDLILLGIWLWKKIQKK